MNLIEQHNVVSEAANQIYKIVRDVEARTGGTISGFSINKIDITNIHHDETTYGYEPVLHYTPPAETMQRLRDGGVFDERRGS